MGCLDTQIQVGGGSKYKINGKNADQSKVHQLFRSVQLNVNNPTFLIMQGRVTKVRGEWLLILLSPHRVRSHGGVFGIGPQYEAS
jgi:hypothetical protein